MTEIKIKCDRCGKETTYWMNKTTPMCDCVIDLSDNTGKEGVGCTMDLCKDCFDEIVKFARAEKFIK